MFFFDEHTNFLDVNVNFLDEHVNFWHENFISLFENSPGRWPNGVLDLQNFVS